LLSIDSTLIPFIIVKEILAFKIGPSYEAHKGSELKQECVKFNGKDVQFSWGNMAN